LASKKVSLSLQIHFLKNRQKNSTFKKYSLAYSKILCPSTSFHGRLTDHGSPTKMVAIATQVIETYNQVAAKDNKTKPLILSQESGKSAGFLTQNKEMPTGDATRGGVQVTPTAPMAADSHQQNTKIIGENPHNTTMKTHDSSQESGKSARAASRNENMRSTAPIC
jgi:hypothetical protein